MADTGWYSNFYMVPGAIKIVLPTSPRRAGYARPRRLRALPRHAHLTLDRFRGQGVKQDFVPKGL